MNCMCGFKKALKLLHTAAQAKKKKKKKKDLQQGAYGGEVRGNATNEALTHRISDAVRQGTRHTQRSHTQVASRIIQSLW